jgi:small-conductance mechanosensitive channel
MIARDVVSETPTDVQHPVMYERAVYIQGGIVGLCVLGIIALLVISLLKGGVTDPALAGMGILGTIAGSAVNSLAQLLMPRGG